MLYLTCNMIPSVDLAHNRVSLGEGEGVAARRWNLGKPRFRHYPLTLGLRFLGLHRRPMLDSTPVDSAVEVLLHQETSLFSSAAEQALVQKTSVSEAQRK